ncbi:MAG: catalase, partial [Tolumonas sp.]
GKNRESHQQDLYESIENGDFPRWDMKVQMMTEEEAKSYPIHPFDLTKVWPHNDFPLIDVGVLELNRNPDNYFAEVEQAAFNPANIVPGIGFSPDKMLQGRLFSYGDTQRYRLGVNHAHIPVNQPKCPVNSFHRDGAMRVDGNYGSTKAYEPNSLGLWQEQLDTKEPELAIQGGAYSYDFREDDDDYFSQPRALFNLMTPEQKTVLFENTARSIGSASLEVQYRHIRNCHQADPAYAQGVADALKLKISDII